MGHGLDEGLRQVRVILTLTKTLLLILVRQPTTSQKNLCIEWKKSNVDRTGVRTNNTSNNLRTEAEVEARTHPKNLDHLVIPWAITPLLEFPKMRLFRKFSPHSEDWQWSGVSIDIEVQRAFCKCLVRKDFDTFSFFFMLIFSDRSGSLHDAWGQGKRQKEVSRDHCSVQCSSRWYV